MMPKEECRACRFFAAFRESRDRGWCRRYPPIVTFFLGEPASYWPTVEHFETCGEFRAVDEERTFP